MHYFGTGKRQPLLEHLEARVGNGDTHLHTSGSKLYLQVHYISRNFQTWNIEESVEQATAAALAAHEAEAESHTARLPSMIYAKLITAHVRNPKSMVDVFMED